MSSPQGSKRHRVVIVGGGFAGLNAARALRRAPVDVTLVDERNFHLFQPLLYQVATGSLSPANIAAPLRSILERQANCQVVWGAARGIDVKRRCVLLDDIEIPYDTLVVCAGARHGYFAHPEWEPYAPGLKTVEDATEIRRRVLSAFELAERKLEIANQRLLLNFVIVGGGPTGVELAGALAVIARRSLRNEFRQIRPEDANIILLEAGDRVLSAYPPELSAKAQAALERLGVTVRTNTKVVDVGPDQVRVEWGAAHESIPTRTVIWAAGVCASPLAKDLADQTRAILDRAGRIQVEPDLSLPGHPEILVLGDMASYTHQGAAPLPGVAPVAIQQGRYAARLIAARLAHRNLPQFHYHDRGNLATIGRRAAVADFGWIKLDGLLAWLLWLIVHLVNLISFRNRLLVLIQWGWSYFRFDRSAWLITGKDSTEPPATKKPDIDSQDGAEPVAARRPTNDV